MSKPTTRSSAAAADATTTKPTAAKHDHDTHDHDDTHAGEVTGLTLDTWFPFSFLAFGTLITFVIIVAWSADQIKNGNYLAIPVLLVAFAGVILSPVIGHCLNLALWEVFGGQGLFIVGVAGVLLAAVVGWLWVEVSVLKRVVGELREELVAVKG